MEPRMTLRSLVLFFALSLLAGTVARAEDEADRKGIEFFENKIRPLLAEKCYKCHSAQSEKLKGALRLDTREGTLKGGQSNEPSVTPGNLEKSLLIKAIRWVDEELQMPPKEKLSPEQIALFESWIKMGAPDPRVGTPTDGKIISADKHWAYQPVQKVAPPEVKRKDWIASPIDAFVLQKLDEKKLEPSPAADKRALIRRATYDLAGLPPTPDEIDAFLADNTPEAFAKVVDRLLASPRYGERWGRHWLDVVRFGESHGYEQNHLRNNAWYYRDYVIRAFNEDKPYTNFVTEQIAGDIVGKDDPNISVATGFLVAGVHDTVGNQSEEGKRQQRSDDLDDIVSTTGSAFLGLTVGCAKCHNHKFDPIPQVDFYHFAAVFAGVRHEERELKMPARDSDALAAEQNTQKLRALNAQISDIDARAREVVLKAQAEQVRRPAVNVQRNVEDLSNEPVQARFVRFTVLATSDSNEPCIDEIEIYAKGSPENIALASKGAKASASSLLPGYPIHQIAHLNDGRHGNEWSWISKERGKGWAQIELPQSAQIAQVVWSRDSTDKPQFNDRLATRYKLETSEDGAVWKVVSTSETRESASEAIPGDRLLNALTPEQKAARAKLVQERDALQKSMNTSQAPKAYIGRFTAPDTIYLLKRGNVMQRMDIVPPGPMTKIPGVAIDPAMEKADEPTRRLMLAKWICDEKNPLTARVMVNRIWQHHFGRGIAATPSDFGANGTPPTHPELLDWLANDFMSHGWTMKRLHRLIMLSNTYQQTNHTNEKGMAVDAGNQFLWRMPLQRLEAEAIRDSILSASGKLKFDMGGPGYQLFKYRVVNIAIYDTLDEQSSTTWRRAVYQQSPRAIREDMLASYDLPETAQRAPRREVTTTPLQALTSLNSVFVQQQSAFFAERLKKDAGERPEAQIARAFVLAFGREPSANELAASSAFVPKQGLAAFCRAILNANEFLTY
jgi:hypothetical protein